MRAYASTSSNPHAGIESCLAGSSATMGPVIHAGGAQVEHECQPRPLKTRLARRRTDLAGGHDAGMRQEPGVHPEPADVVQIVKDTLQDANLGGSVPRQDDKQCA